MAQWGKALATRLDSLSPVPGTHMIEGESHSCKLSSDHHTYSVIQVATPNTHSK